MIRKFLRSKIHRATVTAADVSYEGSISLPTYLLEAADIAELESVHVWNVTSGTRFETYAIDGGATPAVCVNGAAARLVTPGDEVIIAAFGWMDDRERSAHEPKIVFVDKSNAVKELRAERPGPGSSGPKKP